MFLCKCIVELLWIKTQMHHYSLRSLYFYKISANWKTNYIVAVQRTWVWPEPPSKFAKWSASSFWYSVKFRSFWRWCTLHNIYIFFYHRWSFANCWDDIRYYSDFRWYIYTKRCVSLSKIFVCWVVGGL